ncbi:MAG: shufflon system plasmid conjugative transfer pilus tip adhesin PilV [Alphaproteobacteria bacterium]|nr:shufflon system plasmid conjugative transfer pilus tip adhesin PilV [Alphaproteobacteria bacterium]
MNSKFERAEQGFSLLELLLGVVMMAMVIVGVAAIVSRQGDEAKANVVALQLKTIGDAAGEYIKDNYDTIYTNTQAANSKIIITLPMLTASGYLGADFAQGNVYNQNMCVVVRRSANSANNLLGLVVTEGGNPIDDVTLGQIAATIGGAGGGVYSANPTMVRGALGAWTFNTNVFSGATTTGTNCSGAGNVTLAAGHPTMSIWFADGASRSASGTLYRNAVAGQPELNTMNTPLIMGAATTQTAGGACNAAPPNNAPIGAIARDANGAVLSCSCTTIDPVTNACVASTWANAGSAYWGNPVPNLAALGVCNAASAGKVVMVASAPGAAATLHPYVPYTCDGGGTWKAVAIDQNGNLALSNNLDVWGATLLRNNTHVGGTLDVDGNIVINDNGVNQTRLFLPRGNSLSIGGSIFYGDGINSAVRQPGHFYVQAPDGSARSIFADWMIGNYLYPNTVNTVNTGCSQSGLISKSSDGSTLSCVSGVWRKLGGISNVSITANNWWDTESDSACYCPNGTTRVSCSGGRRWDLGDTCDERDCGYIGTQPYDVHGCRTRIDSNGNEHAVAWCYCAQ